MRRTFALVLILAFLFCSAAMAVDNKKSPSLSSKKKSAIAGILNDEKVKNAKVGIRLTSLKTGDTLYAKNSAQLMIPASTNKIVSGAAAIDILGPKYFFETKIYYKGNISPDGTLNGDLIIKGGGDPSISLENAWLIAHKIRAHGITTVTGSLIGDESFFDGTRHYAEWGKIGSRAYHAPMGALSINFNTMGIYVTPGPKAGTKANVTLDPPNTTYQLVNNLETVKGGRDRVAMTIKDGTCFVTGELPIGAKGAAYYRSIPSPLTFALGGFEVLLKNEGVTIQGGVKGGALPAGSRLLFVHESKPLSLIVRDLFRNSNNFTAEQTARTLGASQIGLPGTQQKASTAIEQWLKSLNMFTPGTVINDASGLSRANRLSADTLVDVLTYMWNKPEVSPEFVDAMAIGGVDGTLRRRFRGTPLEGRVRAKSGLLWGVITLAGYCYDSNNEPYAFAILVNDYDKSAGARDIQRIAEKILNVMMK